MPIADPDLLDAAVLGLILQRHPGPVHHEELAHAFPAEDWPASVSGLLGDGAVHREGGFLVASRAAVRVAELLG
jgi:hypothetical protein